MGIAFLIGRIAFVAIFFVSGVTKLMAFSATAAAIQAKIAIPAALAAVVASAEGATGMTVYQLLAIAVGVTEILFPLLIVFNILTRFASLVMLVFVVLSTFFMHDFWNMSDAAAQPEHDDGAQEFFDHGRLPHADGAGCMASGLA